MIKLFRKIRQNSLMENKTGKYFKYAIGEIVLVVIGILIALQINAFKNEQNYRLIEKNVLKTIKEDLRKDTIDLRRLLGRKNLQLEESEFMIGFFANPNRPIVDTAQFITKMRHPFYFFLDNPYKTAFEMAKESSNLFKVRNDSLVEELSFYFSETNLSRFMAQTKTYSTNYNMNILMTKYRVSGEYSNYTKELYVGYQTKVFPFDKYLNDFEMENYYIVLITYLEIGISLIQEKMDRAIKLMKLIDIELEKL